MFLRSGSRWCSLFDHDHTSIVLLSLQDWDTVPLLSSTKNARHHRQQQIDSVSLTTTWLLLDGFECSSLRLQLQSPKNPLQSIRDRVPRDGAQADSNKVFRRILCYTRGRLRVVARGNGIQDRTVTSSPGRQQFQDQFRCSFQQVFAAIGA
ncbi:hypothetical protein K491DRAFT_503449 [Lophiostoma macrostomum CBS 122681]|uniref:Uncharacterized protein n=1 Tax=Lophiostoma macrostomum CBS 122681 TaxID=1314788 RepID=A0A6A6T350_9PLEO|nr:hypothetical protein K491DRAFT_503449 [Lophiostoma macrostomum CBS 122681]